MRSAYFAALAAFALSSCTTGPYQESISAFAKGVATSQSALLKLDQLDREFARQDQLVSSKEMLALSECEAGKGCAIAKLPAPKSDVESPLLYMAKLVTYSNDLVTLAAAKDTDAITKASSQIDATATAAVKSFQDKIAQPAIIQGSLSLAGEVANLIIDDLRVQKLRDAILKHRSAIEGVIDDIGAKAHDLQNEVVGRASGLLASDIKLLNGDTALLDRTMLSHRIVRRIDALDQLAKTDARAPFLALKKTYQKMVHVLQTNGSFDDVASALQDFLTKAQVLDAAVQTGDS